MKAKIHGGGYSTQTAKNYIDPKKPVASLSTELEPQVKFEDKRPTDEIIAYKAWFTQEGLEPFVVKFDERVELPTYMSLVSFDNLQACEVQYKVYFKADDLKEVK